MDVKNFKNRRLMAKVKQETIEEAAEQYVSGGIYLDEPEKQQTEIAFYEGAKWQQERMYNEENVDKLISIIQWYDDESDVRIDSKIFAWFEQFKKK